jgi:phosphatidylinositol-binding clathrin assembly protein
MAIYRTFTKQTDFVVQYLGVARQYEHHTRVEVPKLKHAPVNLGRQLEDYLKDTDFEVHRRQYLAELDAKKSSGVSGGSRTFETKASSSRAVPITNGSKAATAPAQPTKGPDPDLIDFFDSIEQNQTPMAVQPGAQVQPGMTPWGPAAQFQNGGMMPQVTGFPGTNPFLQQNMGAFGQQQQAPMPMQPAITGAGFGGFSPQPAFQPGSLTPITQGTAASFQPASLPAQGIPTGQQVANSNPFRQSMLMTGAAPMTMTPPVPTAPTGSPSTLSPQSTNPFARSATMPVAPASAPTSPPAFASQPPAAAPLMPMATGTNPFAKNFGTPPPALPQPAASTGALVPQPTGSTNPFRQGAFVNHATGMGWQHNQQQMGGGLDQLETLPVFPRPASQSPWQQ